jgi:hypothetical protein
LLLSAGLLGGVTRAQAAERLVLTYGPVGDSVEVAELRTFVETGEIPRTLRPYLRLTNTDPEAVRVLLNKEVTVSLRFLDRALNTLPGEYALFQLGTVIHTPTRTANIQALRAAVVLSASDDNKLSLLEFLENYPTRDVVIDGVAVQRVAQFVGRVRSDVRQRLQAIEQRLDVWLAVAQDLLQGLVCDCEAPASTSRDSGTGTR